MPALERLALGLGSSDIPRVARILTFNSHEAYIANLARTGFPLDVVCDLPGHHCEGWDARMRPIPSNVTIVRLDQALERHYDCVIGHNLTDLLAAKHVEGAARVLVLHSSLTGRVEQEGARVDPGALSAAIRQYLGLVGGRAVVISPMKAKTWGLPCDVIPGAVDVDDYHAWSGDIASGLRVANHVTQKSRYLKWRFHEEIVRDDLPCRLVGVNPDRRGVAPAEGWDDLKRLYAAHRFYVHTAAGELEDGYNLASLEAMASGVPVVTNVHESCPVEDGVSGFVSDSSEVLREGARALLADRERARRMGERAREAVRECFSMAGFVDAWRRVISEAVAAR